MKLCGVSRGTRLLHTSSGRAQKISETDGRGHGLVGGER